MLGSNYNGIFRVDRTASTELKSAQFVNVGSIANIRPTTWLTSMDIILTTPYLCINTLDVSDIIQILDYTRFTNVRSLAGKDQFFDKSVYIQNNPLLYCIASISNRNKA